MKRVIVCGGCGKMASTVALQIFHEKDLQLAGIIEAPDYPSLGNDWGKVMGLGDTDIIVESDLEASINQCDVVTDFTNPEATIEHLETCLKHKKAMVIGTTGLSNEQLKKIKDAAHEIPVVFSPNMSLGVNLLFELVRKVSRVLDDNYDIEIIETHHRYKKDAPSGTAKKIAELIALERGVDFESIAVFGREGNVGQRRKGEIGIHAVRAGNISGEHSVIFNSLGERLEITHKAYSREAFAQGTVSAIHFIFDKPKGFFSMREVLNL